MTAQPDTPDADDPAIETIEDLRTSFFYGARSNLNVKFTKDLTDAEFGDFLEELFGAVSRSTDSGDASEAVDVLYRWQIAAYRSHLGDPASFRHRYDDTPWATMTKPLSQSRLGLITSSGHFVTGDDPKPFGVENMTQAEAEERIQEFVKEAPTLSTIPMDTAFEDLSVRHGGYPTEGAAADPQVVLPLEHLRSLTAAGTIGELADNAYSFVGAASQGRLRNDVAPAWADMLRDQGIDALLLVPI